MQTNAKTRVITFCKYTKLLSTFVMFFLLGSGWIFAQRTININNENSQLRVSQTNVQTQIVDSYYGKSEQSRAFDFNPQLKSLTNKNKGDIILLDFFEEKQYRALIKTVTHSYNGTIGITAKIEGSDFGSCYISISGNDILINTDLSEKNEYYTATSKAGHGRLSRYKMSEIRKNELECISLPVPEPVPTAIPSLSQSTQLGKAPSTTLAVCSNTITNTNTNATIRVLVVYTEKARLYTEDTIHSTINNEINAAMLIANDVSVNSNLGVNFVLAYSYETDYQEVNKDDDLYNLTNTNDGMLDEVHALRKQYNADLVMLVPSVTFTGGVGWLLNTIDGRPSNGFALSRIQQLSWTATMVHEMGHNMGCAHHIDQTSSAGDRKSVV